MTNIYVLPDELINQIAAGEVVERPASVVKELIENALDAKSTKITIEIKEAGKKLIRIVDNGNGIGKDDLQAALLRHATSKIKNIEDLWNIKTMGFRGEALASISSIAKVNLRSKEKSSTTGFKIESTGGKLSNIDKIAMNDGTDIEVKDLFFNTPARQKFLKNDSTELSHIVNIITEYAIGYPWISFKLINNGSLIFDLHSTDDFEKRIFDVLGKEVARNLIKIDFPGIEPNITGFIGKPEIARNNKQSQYIYINGRAVKDNLISSAILDGFHSLLPEKKYPMFIIFLEMNPLSIDVNVHPRKLEVRFAYKNTIYSVVKQTVKEGLQREHLIPEIGEISRSYWNTEKLYNNIELRTENREPRMENKELGEAKIGFKSTSSNVYPKNNIYQHKTNISQIQDSLNFTQSFLGHDQNSIKEPDFIPEEKSIKILGQVNLSYILASDKDGILIIDQHAAHERIMYENLIQNAEKTNPEKQSLLIPEVFELSNSENIILNENKAIFEKIGFEIENFGKNSFQIITVPSLFSNQNYKEILINILDDLIEGKMAKKIEDKHHEIICYTACRSAVKFGQKLSYEEQLGLIEELEKQKQKSTCPHGRPTIIRLTFEELLKRFGRK